ncbi:MAG: NUDIX hydrolase [Acidimicrobiales bacterium]
MRWTVHSERSLYDSAWMSLRLADVELPDGHRFDHHLVRLPTPAAGVVIDDPAGGVLLVWRHRFITDTWGWEVPAGRAEAGEELATAAARETLEETGWRPGPLRLLADFFAAPGVSDHRFVVYAADSAEHVGAPVDLHEAERVERVPRAAARDLIRSGQVRDSFSLVGLALALAP